MGTRLSIKSVTFAAAVLWGASILVVSLANLIWPDYGYDFLLMVSSIYPGYDVSANIGSVIVGTLYALLDGAIGGFIFAWLYNLCAARNK